MPESTRWVALLRGINVGGHRLIKKDELQAVFEGCEFSDVRTVLASGNVVFTSPDSAESELADQIQTALHEALGYPVDIMVRSLTYLKELVELDPFGEVGPGDGHNYVTFLTARPESVPQLPYRALDEHFLALAFHDREFFAVTYKRPDGRYGDFGAFIVREFGKQPVTTRNWKTVLKLAAM